MPILKERTKTLLDLIDSANFLLADRPLPMADIGTELAAVEPWTPETTEQAVRTFAERKGAKLGAIAQPLRAALTGRTTSPRIFEVLAVLGNAESLARIADQTGSQSA